MELALLHPAHVSMLLDRLEKGDEVVVWKLDRLGRNSRNVLELIDAIKPTGATFRSITEGIGTSRPMAGAMLTITSAFAQIGEGHHFRAHTSGSGRSKGQAAFLRAPLTSFFFIVPRFLSTG